MRYWSCNLWYWNLYVWIVMLKILWYGGIEVQYVVLKLLIFILKFVTLITRKISVFTICDIEISCTWYWDRKRNKLEVKPPKKWFSNISNISLMHSHRRLTRHRHKLSYTAHMLSGGSRRFVKSVQAWPKSLIWKFKIVCSDRQYIKYHQTSEP